MKNIKYKNIIIITIYFLAIMLPWNYVVKFALRFPEYTRVPIREAICIGIPTLIYFIITRHNIKKTLSFNKPNKKYLNTKLFYMIGSGLGIESALILLTLVLVKTDVSTLTQVQSIKQSSIFISILFGSLSAPFFEEIMNRGVIYSELQIFNIKYIAIINGLLFGIFHWNILQFVAGFMSGVIFSYILYKTKSIWYTIGLHALINFIAVMNMIIKNGLNINNTMSTKLTSLSIYWLLFVIPYGILCYIFFKKSLKEFLEQD